MRTNLRAGTSLRGIKLIAGMLLLVTFLPGCAKRQVNTIEDYAAYVNESANGLSAEQQGSGLRMTVRFLPPPYLAFSELHRNGASTQEYDSLQAFYARSLTFQAIIEPVSGHDRLQDIIHRHATRQAEVEANKALLNYGMEQYVRLIAEEQAFAPNLAILESTFENDRRLSFIFVFDKDALSKGGKPAEHITLELNKPFFLDAPAAFRFKTESLLHYPQLVNLKL